MATGAVTVFEEFADMLGKGSHNLNATDVIKLGIVDNTLSPTAADATPTWGDYSANEVSTLGGYPANGITLTYAGVTRWAEASGVGTFDADDITLSQNGSGFTDGCWGILYNDTEATDMAIAFVELDATGNLDETAGDININWNASGVLTITVS